jgi:hypothetical protein
LSPTGAHATTEGTAPTLIALSEAKYDGKQNVGDFSVGVGALAKRVEAGTFPSLMR